MTNKTVFITGTSSGIGRATARYFINKGWNVVATMKNPDSEKEFQDGVNVLLAKVDVTDSESIKVAFENAISKFGSVDAIVNNAGYGLLGPLENTTEKQVKDQFDTNVLGTIIGLPPILINLLNHSTSFPPN
jgi:NAD(P)-dependent dehydrogenase (short-subunit alcohol dehydrogenase family)